MYVLRERLSGRLQMVASPRRQAGLRSSGKVESVCSALRHLGASAQNEIGASSRAVKRTREWERVGHLSLRSYRFRAGRHQRPHNRMVLAPRRVTSLALEPTGAAALFLTGATRVGRLPASGAPIRAASLRPWSAARSVSAETSLVASGLRVAGAMQSGRPGCRESRRARRGTSPSPRSSRPPGPSAASPPRGASAQSRTGCAGAAL